MISHDYRCIFIHNRKAAGMAVREAFGFAHTDRDWHLYNNGTLSPEWAFRPKYFVFTIVRNPFDRLISAWRYLPATRDRSLLDVLTNPPKTGHDHRHLTRPQIAALIDRPTGAIVTDAVIKFEELQQGFDRVCDAIGRPRSVLPHMNKSRRENDYRQYYDKRTLALAAAMFEEDLRRFGYSF